MNTFTKAVLALAATIALPATAQATVVFNVNGTFTGGGTLSGTFTTNDARTQVVGVNLTSSLAGGGFLQSLYGAGANITTSLPTFFEVMIPNASGGTNTLRLLLSGFGATGGTIGAGSYEQQQVIPGGGNRSLSGTVTRATAAVPEPSTWAMMLVGFGALGIAMRRKQRATVRYNFAFS